MSLRFRNDVQAFEYDVYGIKSQSVQVNGVDVATMNNVDQLQSEIDYLQSEINNLQPGGDTALSQAIGVPPAGTFLTPPINITNSPSMNVDATLQIQPSRILNFTDGKGNEGSVYYDNISKLMVLHNNNEAGFHFDQNLAIASQIELNSGSETFDIVLDSSGDLSLGDMVITKSDTGGVRVNGWINAKNHIDIFDSTQSKYWYASCSQSGDNTIAAFGGADNYNFDNLISANGINMNNGSSLALLNGNEGEAGYVNLEPSGKVGFSNASGYNFDSDVVVTSGKIQAQDDFYVVSNPIGLQAQINAIGSGQYAQYQNTSDIVYNVLANQTQAIYWSDATYDAIGSAGLNFSSGFQIVNISGAAITLKCDLCISVKASAPCNVNIKIAPDGSPSSAYSSTTYLASSGTIQNMIYSRIVTIANGHYIMTYISPDQSVTLTISHATLSVSSV